MHRAPVATVVIVVAFIAPAGCGGESGPGPPQGGTASELRAVPAGELGCGQCDGPERLTPGYLAWGPDGDLWLTDRWEPLIRAFDRDGELVLAFGRYGQGPGGMGTPGRATIPPLGVFPREDDSFTVYIGMPLFVGHPRAYRIVEHGAEGDARIRLWRIVVADGGPFTPPATP